jgi:hypothetical protein
MLTILSLPVDTEHVDLKHYCLDIIENGCLDMKLRSGYATTLISSLNRMLQTRDRGLQVSAMRILVKLALTEHNERVLCESISLDTMISLSKLMLLGKDEYLLVAATDCLYQLTAFRLELARILAEQLPLWIVGKLISRLPNKQCDKMVYPDPPISSLRSSVPVNDEALPFKTEQEFQLSLRPKIEQLNEPYRAAAWY